MLSIAIMCCLAFQARDTFTTIILIVIMMLGMKEFLLDPSQVSSLQVEIMSICPFVRLSARHHFLLFSFPLYIST